MNQPPRPPGSDMPQFDLSALLMLLLVVGVAAGIAFYMVQGQFAANAGVRLNSHFLFILLTLSAPMLLMVVVSLIRGVVDWLGGPR